MKSTQGTAFIVTFLFGQQSNLVSVPVPLPLKALLAVVLWTTVQCQCGAELCWERKAFPCARGITKGSRASLSQRHSTWCLSMGQLCHITVVFSGRHPSPASPYPQQLPSWAAQLIPLLLVVKIPLSLATSVYYKGVPFCFPLLSVQQSLCCQAKNKHLIFSVTVDNAGGAHCLCPSISTTSSKGLRWGGGRASL